MPEIDLSTCIWCEVCVELCPSVFRMSSSGYIEIIEMDAYPQETVDEAIKNCPSDCISWKE